MIAAAAAAAALAMPIIGTAPGVKRSTFLQPETLRPIPGAARLPAYHGPAALAPNGKTVAVSGFKRLGVYSARTGRRLRSMPSPHADLHWLTANRIVAADPGRKRSAVVVDTRAGKIVRRVPIEGRVGTVAQAGERLLLLVAPQRDAEQSLVVLDADGAVERTVAIPGLHNGTLHPASPDGRAYALGEAGLFAIDLDTGAVTRSDAIRGAWVTPTVPGALAYYDFDVIHILDSATLADRKTIPVEGDSPTGAGPGFTSLAREEGGGVTVYDAEGVVVWHRDRPADGLGIGTIGDRVYVATGYGDVQVRVYDLATGKLIRKNRGRYTASTPDGTYISNAQSLED